MNTRLVSSLVAMLTLSLGLAGCVGAEPTDGDIEAAEAAEATGDADDADNAEELSVAESELSGSQLGCFNSEYFCELTVGSGVLLCPNLPNPNDVKVKSTINGVVLEVDMTNWSQMQVQGNAKASKLYTFHIGDSPTNDGWAGDAGTTQYDAEMFLYDNSLLAYRNDFGGSSHIASLANAIPGGSGSFCTVVGDQEMVWYGTPAGSNQSTSYIGLSDPNLFKPHMGDKKLYVGINRTVGSASRVGSAIGSVVRVSLLPLP